MDGTVLYSGLVSAPKQFIFKMHIIVTGVRYGPQYDKHTCHPGNCYRSHR